MIETEHYKLPFFNLYGLIYKFRQLIINILEKNKFFSLVGGLQMIKQLSVNDNNKTNNFIENSERTLKDITKVLQTCFSTFQSTINEYERKQKELPQEFESITETSLIENQQSLILEQKEALITDLTMKCEQATKTLNQTTKKYQEDIKYI